MKCENKLCIYFKAGFCILNKIQIDELGMCDSCIRVNLCEHELLPKRLELLEKLEED